MKIHSAARIRPSNEREINEVEIEVTVDDGYDETVADGVLKEAEKTVALWFNGRTQVPENVQELDNDLYTSLHSTAVERVDLTFINSEIHTTTSDASVGTRTIWFD